MLRLMDVKCRPGSLGKGELCRTVLAFDLACRALGCEVPHKTAVKLCGAPEDVYASALGTAQRYVLFGRFGFDVSCISGSFIVADCGKPHITAQKYKMSYVHLVLGMIVGLIFMLHYLPIS